MKRIVCSVAVLLPLMLVYVHANAKPKQNGYETATVVSVDKYVSPSNSVGGSPTDAPLQAESYSYAIGVRLDCNIYVSRYESATDYLPAAFAPNHMVDVRLDNHVIYVSLPEGDRIVKMGIVSHRRVKDEACHVNA